MDQIRRVLSVSVVFAAILFLSAPVVQGAVPTDERDALIDLYNFTNGVGWFGINNWNDVAGTECAWYGVTCDAVENNVTGIELTARKLLGPIPASIGNLTQLETLRLEYNDIDSIPPEIGSLVNLQTLNLFANDIPSLPPEIGDLSGLQWLSLAANPMTSLPDEIGNLVSLDTLYIGNIGLTSLPNTIGNLVSLTLLDIWGPSLTTIPQTIGNLASLQTLQIYSTPITSLPTEIGGLSNLTTLNVGSNQLSALPAEIGGLANLATLDARVNQLTALPSEIGGLANLATLDVSSNQLSALPAEIGGLANLTTLDASTNQLASLPVEIGSLTSISTLKLCTNQLTSIPTELGSLSALTILQLCDNQLNSVPSELGNLSNLSELLLHMNQLTSLPPELGNLSNLTRLYLYENQIETLPPEIGNLSNLDWLLLWLNNLNSLPVSIGNLASLTDLNLGDNMLVSLPSGIGALSNLVSLNVRENSLISLPPQVWDLSNLKSLGLEGNRLTGPIPEAITGLSGLNNSSSSFSYNALYAQSQTVHDLIADLDWNTAWINTQSIAPAGLANGAVGDTYVDLIWNSIAFMGTPLSGDIGGYEVYYSDISGGGYNLFETTVDKTVEASTVTGLLPGTTYYFVLRTKTEPHLYNPNTVFSGYSTEISVLTTGSASGAQDISVTDSMGVSDDLLIEAGAKSQTVTVENTGSVSLTLSNMSISGTDAGDFTLYNGSGTGGTCGDAPVALGAGASCTMTLTHTPSGPGERTASLDIASDDPDEPLVRVTLVTNNPPYGPELVMPLDGKADLSNTLTFGWNTSYDPEGHALSYDLYVCADPSFLSCALPVNGAVPILASSKSSMRDYASVSMIAIVALGMVFAGGLSRRRRILAIALVLAACMLFVSCGGGDDGVVVVPPSGPSADVQYTVSGLGAGTTYYWKVTSTDGADIANSIVWSFTTR
jgi:Leucine-rich repeat (LRR) protein